eukprot:TRINITY_DN39178_c0_g1_i1.p1 TRINITY_DN39178_c0_g1~~TRINITY_DN39178_c0_g1_i1.p1  ORF type:complete len:1090 (+),score=351.82 TRINITY_DN39178_c0_g1_i1:50-3319(+)
MPAEGKAGRGGNAARSVIPESVVEAVPSLAGGGKGVCWQRIKEKARPQLLEMIELLLHSKAVETLQTADPDSPFADDLEFLTVLEYCYILQYQWYGLKAGSLGAFALREFTRLELRAAELLAIVAFCRDCLYTLADLRLHKTRKTPLALVLCEKLQLTRSETRAFLFVLINHGGVQVRTFTDARSSIASTAKFAGLNSFELLSFVGEERKHFKQGLVGVSHTDNKSRSPQSLLKVPQEVVAALYGVKLTETEFLKLDKTSLEDLVQEEGLVCMGDMQGPDDDEAEEMEEDVTSVDQDHVEPPAKRRRSRSPPRVKPDAASPAAAAAPAARPSPPVPTPATASATPPPDEEAAETVLPQWSPTIQLSDSATISGDQGPYTHDLQYLDDMFKLLANQIRLRTTESDLKDDDPEMLVTPKSKQEAQLRELKGKERMLKVRIERRMQRTRAAGLKLPQMEELQRQRGYTNFEKMVMLLLVGNIMSHDILIAANGKYVMRGEAQRECTVGYVLYVLCEALEERISRRCVFYKTAALLRDGLLTVTSRSCGAGDLMECTVDIDKRMVDKLMGLQTELHEVVEGSHLYAPKIGLDNVVLQKDRKDQIMSTITNYDAFQRCKKRVGLDDIVSYGNGLTMLFYGPSGTGKTMLANAIAHQMGRKVLLVSLQQVRSSGRSPELLRFVFREAKLNDAVIFFDECDAIFESRERNEVITSLLQELEKYSGLMLMATNKAQTLDQAMNRRITMAIEFQLPDHHMRCEIWRKHIPQTLRVSDGVDWAALAMDYELSGGLIKNAVLTSIASAVAREGGSDNPMLKMEDFVKGAKTQLRSFLRRDLQLSRQVPRVGLEELILEPAIRSKLDEYVQLHKGKRHLHSVWGFSEGDFQEQNPVLFIYGPSGTGKSLIAEAIGYECGHPLHTVNVHELLVKGQAQQKTVLHVYEQAKQAGAMLVLDESQDLFDFSSESRDISQLIHYYARQSSRPVVVIARTDGQSTLDPKAAGLLAHRTIKMGTPRAELRLEHWKKALPKSLPQDTLGLQEVAEKPLTPGAIRSAVYFAAARAAMQPADQRVLTREFLHAAIDDVIRLREGRHASIYT